MSITTISKSLKSIEDWAEETGITIDAITSAMGQPVALVYDPMSPHYGQAHGQAYGVKIGGYPGRLDIDWMSRAEAIHEFALAIL